MTIRKKLDDALKVLAERPALVISGGLALLAMACLAAIGASFSGAAAQRWVVHTLEVKTTTQRLVGAVWSAEASQRNYLITNDESFLHIYEEAKTDLLMLQDVLHKAVLDNPVQKERLNTLKTLFEQRIAVLERALTEHRSGRPAEAIKIVSLGTGKKLMQLILDDTDAIDAEESRLLQQREADARNEKIELLAIMLFCILAAGLLGSYLLYVGRRYTRTLEERNEALASEVAQREHAEAQLRQSQKMEALGRLTGGIAHDFNNMLAVILGNLDLAKRRMPAGEDRVLRLLDSALEGGKSAAVLTQRLLAFSRLQPLDPKPTDINRCVSSMAELMRRTLGEDIQIENVLGGGLWRARIDQAQLESAVLNLAVNAADAMNGKGKLTIETSNTYLDQAYAAANAEVSPGQYVLVAVTDTGAGMTPEVLTQAFDPFFTTKPKGEGTGLGLSQVHGFIKQSGGHVKIYSEIGVGTTIKLYLPRDETASVAVAEGALSRGPPPRATVVLVVEDQADVRQFVVEAVMDLGHVALGAEGAETALALLEKNPDIAILLTDVVMPNVNGRALADEAKTRCPGLKVIFMTGYTRNAIVHNGILDSGMRLLTKPFTLPQLEAELRLALGHSSV